MPHQCVRCNVFYQEGAQEILKGCKCGGRLFFYIKQQHIDEGKKILSNLTVEDKKQIEEDVTEILTLKLEPNAPVVLDIEAIRILAPGKYELDLVHLFKKDPLIIKLDEGKYVIDLPHLFKEASEERKIE
jgi:predicted  nucleic acid-binding Zn-ribbon protein